MHTTHTTARRGGNNPLQRARRQQLQLVAPLGLTLGVILVGILVLVGGDLGRGEYAALRCMLFILTALAAALIRRWLRLTQRIARLHSR